MKPQLQRVGTSQSPLVIIDDFSGAVEEIVRIADALAPFPRLAANNYYPGVRRIIDETDTDAMAYARTTCERVAPFLGGGFGLQSFDLTEASFSVVTTRPEDLQPVQRAPHFDSPDQDVLAMLHYLRVPEESGTAFYRQRSTGIERVTNDNLGQFVSCAEIQSAKLSGNSGYISGSNEFFELIGSVEAVADRLVIYHGSLLHSGIIPPHMPFEADPSRGRLSANFFIQGVTET